MQGTLVNVKKYGDMSADERTAIASLAGEQLDFFVVTAILGYSDNFYFTDNSWPILRDVGLFSPQYRIVVRLTRLQIGDRTVDIYPQRDVAAT